MNEGRKFGTEAEILWTEEGGYYEWRGKNVDGGGNILNRERNTINGGINNVNGCRNTVNGRKSTVNGSGRKYLRTKG